MTTFCSQICEQGFAVARMAVGAGRRRSRVRPVPIEIHAMGPYWEPNTQERTPLGELVASAKDGGDREALDELCRLFAAWVGELDLAAGASVVAVPDAPGRGGHPVRALTDAVAGRLGVAAVSALIRRHSTAPVRETPPDERPALVATAGFEVAADVAGAHIVLVDDVTLTGSTLDHLARLLESAGAASVVAVVAARTRRAELAD